MKSGYAVIVGRPNSGKSTLLNNILEHKVSITSPKPQTTRFPIHAVYEDERGQIIFVDTPGMFGKIEDPVSKKINPLTEKSLKNNVDVVIYLIDHSKDRDFEENKIFGLIRPIRKPKILAVNKIDIKKPSFLEHYLFMENEFDKMISISGLYKKNINYLLDAIFDYLPIGNRIIKDEGRATPLLNLNSKTFSAEIIREKAYIFLRKELPYSLTVVVDEITPRNNKTIFINARIITNNAHYKKMIIGEKGRMIKEIGMAARKELQTATNQKIYIDLTVEVNAHWHEQLL